MAESEGTKAAKAENGGVTPLRSSPETKLRNILAQLVAASSKYLIMLNIGMGISFPTIAIPPILNAAHGLSMNEDESSWFASLVFVFQPVGSLSSVIVAGLGRKRSMFYLQIPLFVGWILPYFAQTVWEMYVASAVMGLGIGFMQAPIATYIGEVTQPKYRGLLACIAYCFLTLGSVVIYAIDVINGNWRQTSLICSLTPILTAILLYMIPESPVWLVSKGRCEEAHRALAWLRGWVTEAEVEAELKNIVYHNDPKYAAVVDAEVPSITGNFELDHMDNSKQCTEKKSSNSTEDLNSTEYQAAASKSSTKVDKHTDTKESWIKLWGGPEMYRPLILSTVFLVLSNGIGVATFRPYLILIFQEYKVNVDEYIATVGVTMIGLIGNIVSVIMMPLVGKRKLTMFGVLFSGFGCAILGIYSFFGQEMNMTWIPIAIMILIFFATNVGVGHIPWVLMSEIFPLKGRTIGTAVVAGIGNFLQFLGTKLFPTFNEYLQLGGIFIMYAVTFVVGQVYLYFYMFETEGKALDEIVTIFRTKGERSHTRYVQRSSSTSFQCESPAQQGHTSPPDYL